VKNKEQFFLGEFSHSLDSQRRVAIPKIWRKERGATVFYLLPGRRKTIQVIPEKTFSEMMSKTKKISFADASASLALARLGRMAQECKCDPQGRIQVSQNLAEYAGIKDFAILVGAINVIQIWADENWKKSGGSDDEILDIIQKIGERPEDIFSSLKERL
jgi:MraZ protein